MTVSAVDAVTGEVVQDAPTLAELESVIERGLESFVEVGWALLTIKVGRRYREAGYSSFEDYCMRRWEISRGYGYRLVLAASTVEGLQRELSPMGDTPLPTSERQTRPLTKLPEGERAEAWTEAAKQAEAEGRPVTARDVEEAVEARRPKTTETERVTQTRQTVTEDLPDESARAALPPVDEESVDRERAHPADPATDSADDDDAEAINRAFHSAVDPALTYRVNVDKALSKAHALVFLDVTKAVATAGESAVGHRQLVSSIHKWCDQYLKAAPSHLRRVP